MRMLACLFLTVLSLSCHQQTNNSLLQARLDSIDRKMNEAYRPGFGEFMSSIQMHHAKLWFAGSAGNWKLADFEIHEIQETLDDIQQYNVDRPESKKIIMINPAMDSIAEAIKQHNESLFKKGYILLTSTCNNCHKATAHEFNVITIPSTPPVSNQSFKVTQ